MLNRYVTLLIKIQENPKNPTSAIDEFQRMAWDLIGFDEIPSAIQEVLIETADTFDYFEADPKIRTEDPSYYGEGRLMIETRGTLEAIGGGQPQSPPGARNGT